jgi:hypothetical protein
VCPSIEEGERLLVVLLVASPGGWFAACRAGSRVRILDFFFRPLALSAFAVAFLSCISSTFRSAFLPNFARQRAIHHVRPRLPKRVHAASRFAFARLKCVMILLWRNWRYATVMARETA